MAVFESLSSFHINEGVCKVVSLDKEVGCNAILVQAGGAQHCWVTREAMLSLVIDGVTLLVCLVALALFSGCLQVIWVVVRGDGGAAGVGGN